MSIPGSGPRVVVLQPSYLPWLGYFDQLALADVFVFYDDVQYDKNGWRNRNRIRTDGDEGWSWLTIPVQRAAHLARICETHADARVPWRKKHRRSIEAAYGRAPHRALLDTALGPFFAADETNLAEIAIGSVRALAEAFGITTPTYRSSQLAVGGDRNARLLAICKHFEAASYLSGVAAQEYLDVALFTAAGIRVEWQAFEHPVYAQTREPFVSHLSAVDALLCAAPQMRERFAR